MQKSAVRWVAVSLAAAVIATSPAIRSAEESGPEKADSATSNPSEVPPGARKRETYPFQGVIASTDTSARTVTLAGKVAKRVIQLTDQTRLVKDGKPAVMDDLKEGERVGGTLRRNGDGREEALLVRIGLKPEGEAKPPSKKKTKPPKQES